MTLPKIANLIRLRMPSRTQAPPRITEEKTEPRSAMTLLAREERTEMTSSSQVARKTDRTSVVLGVDFGSSQISVCGQIPGIEEPYVRRCLPSAVAYQPPENDENSFSPYLYFGEEALNKSSRFKRVQPWRGGDIEDPAMAREVVRHVRHMMRGADTLICRAVVGEPSLMSGDGRQHLRQAVRGLFEQVVFLPRPYLAGLGLKEALSDRRTAAVHHAPVLLIDMGAGVTEGCLIGREFPSPAEMSGVNFGGDQVELMIQEALRQEYPAFRPEPSMIHRWKDEFGFVGEPVSTIVVKVPVDAMERQIVLTQSLRRGCEAWLLHVVELVEKLVRRGTELGQRPAHLYLTGGGSRLVHLVPALERILGQRGLDDMGVELAPESEISLAAAGALQAARRVRDDQWQRFELA